MNHHTLSDFRVAHLEILDGLLTRSFAACLHAGLADVERVAQDGVRVRAGTGAASFRRRLAECHELAKAEVALAEAEARAAVLPTTSPPSRAPRRRTSTPG
jgi:hypothetical protein